MNPMMMMAALGAGLFLLMQRGQAALGPRASERAEAPAAVAPPTQVVAPFETGGDDARDVKDLGPTGPDPTQKIVVQPGDRKTVTQRGESLITTTPLPAVPAARRAPQIVPISAQPSIR
jgi:hypothetical protein